MTIRRHHASDQDTCISCIANCIRYKSRVPRPPLIRFNLGREVGWVTYTYKYEKCLHTSEDGENTSSTHILLCVLWLRSQPQFSRAADCPRHWMAQIHYLMWCYDIHGMHFFNSLCGLMVDRLFGAHMPCHEAERDWTVGGRHRRINRDLDWHFTSAVSSVTLLVDLCVDSPLIH